MGINAIKCEGYADVKEIGFGKGLETASDLEAQGGIFLLGSIVLAAGAALALSDIRSQPEKVSFYGEGDKRVIGGPNGNYQIELTKLDNETRGILVGKGVVAWRDVHTAHFNVTDTSTSETNPLTLGEFGCVELDRYTNVCPAGYRDDTVEIALKENRLTKLSDWLK